MNMAINSIPHNNWGFLDELSHTQLLNKDCRSYLLLLLLTATGFSPGGSSSSFIIIIIIIIITGWTISCSTEKRRAAVQPAPRRTPRVGRGKVGEGSQTKIRSDNNPQKVEQNSPVLQQAPKTL